MIEAISKLIGLFTPSQKRMALILVILMFGGMILETLGIGMVVPAMILFTRDDLASRFPHAAAIVASIGLSGRNHLVIAGMLTLAAVYTLKCLYISWVTSLQMRYVYEMQASISRRLFISYLHKPYTFHLQRNSSELVRNVITATNELTTTGLVSLLILTTESLVLAGISMLLLYVEPVGTVVAAGFLAVFGFTLNRATRTGIRRAGEARYVHEEMRIRYLQQAIGGAKELRLLGRERGTVMQYSPPNEASARIGQRQATLQALPKLWLELLAVLGLVALVLTLIWQGKPIDNLIPTIAMFAAAAFRLIPSMNRILGSIQFIRYSIPTINTLHVELNDAVAMPDAIEPRILSFTENVSVHSISVRYPQAESLVIRDATFSIARGTTVGFIGGSGAGKSTLVDALLGLLPLEHGEILVDGVDINADLRAWQHQIGYVPQTIYLTDDSIRRNIAFGLPDEEIDEISIQRALLAAQLDTFINQLPDGLDTVAGERGIRLSGGQRQRIGIARALYHNPSILVLDEATSSLDTDTENGVMQAINALHGSKTILIVTHRANTLKYCDRVIRIEHGSAHEVADDLIH